MPAATARPFLKLVTQTLPDPAAGYGDLEDRLHDLERFALDFDRYAATPGLRSLAVALLDLTRGLVREAEGGALPRQWQSVISDDISNIATPDDLKARLALCAAALETLEEAGCKDFPDADASVREAWARGVSATSDTLKEIREYAGAEFDDAELVAWVIDQTAYEERAEQWGGLPALLNAAEDGVVAKAVGASTAAAAAEETHHPHAHPDPRLASAPEMAATIDTLTLRLDAAKQAAAAATAARDEARAEADELRAVVANVRKALGDLVAALPGASAAASTPPAEVPPPPPPSMLAAIGEAGAVVDTEEGRFGIAGDKTFALFDYRVRATVPRLVCGPERYDLEDAMSFAARVHGLVYTTAVVTGVLGKLPKASDAPEDCVAVRRPDGTCSYFSLRLLRTVLQGSKHARFHLVQWEGREGLVLMIGDFRGGLLPSRMAPADAADAAKVPDLGEILRVPPEAMVPPRAGDFA